jgi:uncharacterized protein YdbL (DUF1318 family)
MGGKIMKRSFPYVAALAGGLMLAVAAPVVAQDYNAAKAAGQVGEKPDGYVGIVGSGSPELRRMVDDTNIKRKAVYAEKAKAERATVEEYAFTSGCLLIAKTQPGMKYQTPGGAWKTRDSSPPERDSRCP